MTQEEAAQLEHGIYNLHLHSGGTILAAVGSDPSGKRWIAACNWATVGHTFSYIWEDVCVAELLLSDRPYREFNHNAAFAQEGPCHIYGIQK